MKKQTKTSFLYKHVEKGEHKNIAKEELSQQLLEERQKARMKNKKIMLSSPNKENQFGNANQLPTAHLSPLSHHSNMANMNSPMRTTAPHEMLQCLKSNKSKEAFKEDFEKAEDKILFSGFSKDNKYRVESRVLEGYELARAVEYQKKVTICGMLAAEKQKSMVKIPYLQNSKTSSKQNGFIKAYAVNTHSGISRNYNEDRVSITLNIKKNGIRSQFLAIYDGHGGSNCCDFLKDHLHQYLINHKQFPQNPRKALFDAIMMSEERFCQLAKTKQAKQPFEKSGSCALICLIMEESVYVANVGDSRAILSTEGGKFAFNLSRDHRPIDQKQQQRVISAGGKIYRTEMSKMQISKNERCDPIIGPLRIYPGKLSVSRTIGDIEAKQKQLGGMRGVISPEPEIRKFKLTGKEDFILLCCDGILERMDSIEVIQVAWTAIKNCPQGTSIHQIVGRSTDEVVKQSMRRRSSDNVTAIMICLSDMKNRFESAKNYRSV